MKQATDKAKAKTAKPPKGKAKKAKPTEDAVEREYHLCLRRCHKHGSEHEVKVRLAEILFRVFDGEVAVMAESVTYPGKGVYPINVALNRVFGSSRAMAADR